MWFAPIGVSRILSYNTKASFLLSGRVANKNLYIYVGQTKNHLATRLNQHKLDIKQHNPKTAFSQHALQHMHPFNFDNTKILEKETNTSKRLIK